MTKTLNGSPAWRRAPFASMALAATCSAVQGFEIDTGDTDLSLRWDSTIKYSVAARVKSADPIYTGTDNVNGDDGNRNFRKGIVSNRLDLFTESDLVWRRRFGLRLSAAGYYDTVYNSGNDNPGLAGGAFPNNVSTAPNQFTQATRNRMGRKAELLDAFVFGKTGLGDTGLSFRLGRHALTWGESLFFGGNAISGGMMPVDGIKLASIPGTQFKEAIRPVPMASTIAQLSPELSVSAYYQFRWEKTLIPPSGSYLSNADSIEEGGERLLIGPMSALRLADRKPKDSGQGGVQLRYRTEAADYGAYVIRYHEKAPQLVSMLGVVPGVGTMPTGYYLAYNQGVTAYALTANSSFGLYNFGLEVGLRHNASLASTQGADASGFSPAAPTDLSGNPGYATGKTAHVNLSMLATLDENPLWREASLSAEVAWNRALSITKNAAALDPNGTRDGYGLRVQLEPTYRGVFSGVDIGVPVGLGWSPRGSRPLAAGGPGLFPAENGGDISVGLNGSFQDAWRFTLNYTHYYGRRAPGVFNTAYTWQQTLGDRDFVSASLRYAF